MVMKWVKKREIYLRKALEGCVLKKLRLNPNKNPRHAETHKYLHEEFIQKRKKGKKVSFMWLFITGKKIAIKYSLPTFTRKGVEMFTEKFNIKIRRTQRKKQKPKSIHMEAIKQWHLNLRETVVKSNKEGNEQYDPVFGRYPPDRRFNVDQVHIEPKFKKVNLFILN